MNSRNGRAGGITVLEKNQYVSLRCQVRQYNGKEYVRFVGAIPLSGNDKFLVSIPTDENGRLMWYEGKDKNADKRYCRMYVTKIRQNGGGLSR